MLSRGLSGAESPKPWAEPPTQNQRPPTAPAALPPTPAWEVPPEPVFGLQHWRHPVALGPEELWDYGFERVGDTIAAAFAANGQSVELATMASELLVNDVSFVTDPPTRPLDVKHVTTDEIEVVDAAVWAVTVALHDAYLERLDPDRSWHIAGVGNSYVVFLARPEELPAIGRRPEIDRVLELGKLQPL